MNRQCEIANSASLSLFFLQALQFCCFNSVSCKSFSPLRCILHFLRFFFVFLLHLLCACRHYAAFFCALSSFPFDIVIYWPIYKVYKSRVWAAHTGIVITLYILSHCRQFYDVLAFSLHFSAIFPFSLTLLPFYVSFHCYCDHFAVIVAGLFSLCILFAWIALDNCRLCSSHTLVSF